MHSLTNWPFTSFQTKISTAGHHIYIPTTCYSDPIWNGEVNPHISFGGDLFISNVRLIYYSISVSLISLE